MRVLTYNVCEDCRLGEERVAAVIAAERPDAVALQEVRTLDTARRLGDRLGMNVAFGDGNCGWHVAWLSRAPVVRSTNHRDDQLAKTLLEIELEWGSLFATHLASRHEAWTHPWEEVPLILGVLRRASARHLLVGDLNCVRFDDPIGQPPPGVVPRRSALHGPARRALAPLLAEGYVDCYRALHPDEAGFTYSTDRPWLRVDYVFAAPALATELRSCDVVDGDAARRASDHLPVRAEF